MKKISTSAILVAAITAAVLLTGAAHATQALAGSVEADPQAKAQPFMPQISEWTGPTNLRDLVASNFAFAASSDDHAFLSAHSALNAHWASANAGQVNITNDGLIVSQPGRISGDIDGGYRARWGYRFLADQAGILNFGLSASLVGSDSDIGQWQIAAIDLQDPENFVLRTAEGFDGKETLERTGSLRLIAGHTYDFFMKDAGAKSLHDFPGLIEGNETGAMTWSITPDAPAGGVPEPTAWVLMLLGFATLGAVIRRVHAGTPARRGFVRSPDRSRCGK